MRNTLFEIPVEALSKNDILEKIKNYTKSPRDFFHIVSLNPENIIMSEKTPEFKEVLQTAQIKIIDGVGMILAGMLLQTPIGYRITGVDLMEEILDIAHKGSSRVVLIGGGPKVADEVIRCQSMRVPNILWVGIEGIKNIRRPTREEEQKIFTIVADFKPHFLFAAFGSPYQKLWLYQHREKLQGIVCMGVGGAFDYLAEKVPRAPRFMQMIGFEWLFRLVHQPWRMSRQLRLFSFVWLVFKELFKILSRVRK